MNIVFFWLQQPLPMSIPSTFHSMASHFYHYPHTQSPIVCIYLKLLILTPERLWSLLTFIAVLNSSIFSISSHIYSYPSSPLVIPISLPCVSSTRSGFFGVFFLKKNWSIMKPTYKEVAKSICTDIPVCIYRHTNLDKLSVSCRINALLID